MRPDDGIGDCSEGNLSCDSTSALSPRTDNGELCGQGEGPQLYPTCLAVTRIMVQMLDNSDEFEEAKIANFSMSKELQGSLDKTKHIKFAMKLNTSEFVGSANINQACLQNKKYTNQCIKEIRIVETVFQKYLNLILSIPLDPNKLKSKDVWLLIEYSPVEKYAEQQSRNVQIGELLHVTQVLNFSTTDWKLENFGLENHDYWLPKIKHLDLSVNGILKTPSGKFYKAPNLLFLNMSNNLMTELPVSLGEVTSLTHIDMSYNKGLLLKRGPYELRIFGELINLEWIDLSGISMKKISFLDTLLNPSRYDSNNSITLKELYLKDCQIQDMDDDTVFNNQNLLTILDISFNKIDKIPSETFSKLSNLEYLDLSHNELKNSQCIHLPSGRTIDIVDMSYNKFTRPDGIISKGSVNHLNLAHSQIEKWSSKTAFLTVYNESVTKTLDLSFNKITKTSKEMGPSIDVLKSIDLSGNDFDCLNCHTIGDFQNWLKTVEGKRNKVQIKDFKLNISQRLTCKKPQNVTGKFISEIYINFDDCLKITNYGVVVGIPVAVCAALLLVLGSITYKYRFEATYLIQHFKIKRRKALNTSDPGKFEYDVFVCYSRNDRDWVTNELCAQLEEGEDKYVMRLHERDFPLGTMILENVEESMNQCRFTIAVLSNNFVKSQWCRWELEMANYKLFRDNREFLILLELERLNRSEIPRHLKYLVETRTYLEWPEDPSPQDKENLWRRLRSQLGESNYQISQRNDEQGNPKDQDISDKQIELRNYPA